MDGLFLHAGWRSAGTWLWQKLRAAPGNMGFYEPLHEYLPYISAAELTRLSPQSWDSRHGDTATPYFAEYAPLLRSEGHGVKLALPRFAYGRFFQGAEPDAALTAYIGQLIDLARAGQKLPVFKCTRTQGRLPWFRAQFPHMRHVALIRQPWAQFCSAWRCQMEDGNGYFLAAPFMVLERNRRHRDVAALTRHFGLVLGLGQHLPLVARQKAWNLAVRLCDAATLYKAHFSLWLLSALAAQAADLVLNGDAPPAQLANALGLASSRTTRPVAAPTRLPALRPEALRRIHAEALSLLAHRIGPAQAARLQPFLAAAEAAAERDLCDSAQGALALSI